MLHKKKHVFPPQEKAHNMESWHPFASGTTIGATGTENGIIRLDEEFSLGARITLEEGGFQPWAITCGMYDFLFVCTVFASSEAEARAKYAAMKQDLGNALEHAHSLPDEEGYNFLCGFGERFDTTYW